MTKRIPKSDTPSTLDAIAEAPLTPEQQAQQQDIERKVSEANAAVRAAAGWTRDDDRLIQKLEDIGGAFADLSIEAVVQSWTDHEAFTAEGFADAMTAEGRYTSADGEEFNADGTPIPLPAILAAWEITFEPAPEDATFDAEQVEAAPGDTPGDKAGGIDLDAAIAAIDDAFADEAAEGIDLAGDRHGVDARIAELQILVDAPRLYRSPEGYSSNYGAPYIADTVVHAWIVAGIAEDIPTAGNDGGVRLTPAARRLLADLKQGEAA